MNKKIKMIEFLNKMNNQEELPRKIQYGYDNNNCPAIWRFMVGSRDYWCSERDTMDNYLFRDYIGDITAVLDNEVEILEDNTEEIEELEKEQEAIANPKTMLQEIRFYYDSNKMGDKINEIIRYIKRKDKSDDN